MVLNDSFNYCRVQEAPKDLSKAQASEEDDNQGFVGLNSLKNILPSFFNRDQVLVTSNYLIIYLHLILYLSKNPPI